MGAAAGGIGPLIGAFAQAGASVAAARLSQPKIPKMKPTRSSVLDQQAAEAADRERRRRTAASSRKTVLTSPLGAVESPLVRRSVLSGG